jgi:NADPH:quinone reductase-like Zn-dependent oxidoreductase
VGKSTHAEYLAKPQDGSIVPIPANVGNHEAAAVPFGALSAVVVLRDFAKVQPGQKVLVNGASGGVGVSAVQLAKPFGAEVTAVTSTDNVELVRSLGADRVIDYKKEDFSRSDETYDVVLDPVGKSKFADVKRVLKPDGVYVPLEFALTEIVQALTSSLSGGPRISIGISGDSREDLELLASLLANGELRPVIDSRVPLARIVDAHRRVEGRHKTGSVVVTVGQHEASVLTAA